MSPVIKSFSPQDIYISCLEGYYEGLNGGVTSYIDHAHNNWDLEAFKRGYDAAVDSGARIWWCPSVEDREGSYAKDQWDFMSTLGTRTKDQHPLVSLGLAYDSFGGYGSGDDNVTKDMIKYMPPANFAFDYRLT